MNVLAAAPNHNETLHFDYEKRRYNDTVTWLAEVLPGHMRTPFEYRFDGRELYADDGSPLGDIFDDAIRQAEQLPGYEQRRRLAEKEEYHDMVAMMRGELPNTMVVVSDFPPELMDATQDVGGYNAARKQTMLRVLVKTDDNTLMMYSQSLDRSDRRGLEALYSYFGIAPAAGELLGQRIYAELDSATQEFLVDRLMGIYDRQLAAQYGGEWYAGRSEKPPVNTYDFVCSQGDLLRAYLATTDHFGSGDAEYNLAAALSARYKNHLRKDSPVHFMPPDYTGPAIAAHILALDEMKGAGTVARQTGETFSGCGSSLRAGNSGERSGDEQLDAAGYGNKSDKLPDDKYGSRYFKCPRGHQNVRRKKNELIERCQVCNCNVRCD